MIRMAGPSSADKPRSSLEMLDELIREYYEALKGSAEAKANMKEFIKMVEVGNQLAPGGADQSEFWNMLDKMRQEVLGGRKKNTTRKKKPAKSPDANAP